MSTAAKLRKKAAELEQQKQYDKAVQTYKRALEDEERDGDDPDVQLYNRIGDLLIRQGSVAEAVNYLEKAVDLYTASDLHNNAIALCNKILRHTPGRSGIYHTLGRICAKKGLRGDATRNFVEYAARMQQAGRIDEALAALTEFVDLVPENSDFRALLDTHVATVGRHPGATGAVAAVVGGGLTVLDTSGSRLTPPIGLAGVAAAAKPVAVLPTNGAVHSAYVVKPAPMSELIFLSVEFESPAVPGTAPRTTLELDMPSRETLAVTPLVAEPEVVILEAPVAPVADLQVFAELPPAVEEEPTTPLDGFEATRAVDGLLLITDAMGGALAGLELTRLDAGDVSLAPTIGALAGLESNRIESPADGVSVIADDRSADAVAVVHASGAGAAEASASAVARTPDRPAPPVPAPVETPAPYTPAPHARVVVRPLRTPPSLDGLLLLEDGRLTPPEPATAVIPDGPSADASVVAPAHDGVMPTLAEREAAGDAEIGSPTDDGIPTLDPVGGSPTVDPVAVELQVTVDQPTVQDEASAAVFGANDAPAIGDPVDLSSVEDVIELSAVGSAEPFDAVADAADPDDWSALHPAADDLAAIVDEGQTVDAPPYAADLAIDPPFAHTVADIDVGGVDAWASATAIGDAESALVLLPDDPDDTPNDGDGMIFDVVAVDAASHEPLAVEVTAADEREASETNQSLAVVSAAELDVLVGAGPLFGEDARSFTPMDTSVIHAMWESPECAREEDIIEVGEFEDLPSLSLGSLFDAVEIDGDVLLPTLDEHASRAFWAHDPHDLALPGELPPLDLPGVLDALPHEAPSSALDDDDDLRIDFAWESLDDLQAELPSEPSAGIATQRDEEPPSTPDLLDDLLDIAPAAAAIDVGDADSAHVWLELTPAVDGPVAPSRAIDVDATTPLTAGFGEVEDDLLDAMFATSAVDASADRSLAALRIAVARAPYDWPARRRLTDALFECGDVEHAIAVLTETSTLLEERGRLADAAQATDEVVRVRPDLIDGHQRRVELAVRANDASRLSVSYLDLADALVRLGEAPKAQAVYLRVLELDPFDQRARAALGPSAPPAPERRPQREYVELGAWLTDDGPSTRFTMPAPEPTGDEDADFQLLLQRFKEGVAQAVGDEDHESHYDLGVAYKEMGLTEDAIAEFQKALRSRQNRLRSYEALGQCFVEQRNYQVAVTVMHRALQEPGIDEEQLVGVLFLLGYASEALQRWPEARGYYERVVATDITFRDVAARLAALDRLTTR